jgi:hypothetical protein
LGALFAFRHTIDLVKGLVLAVLALVGCDSVFGLEGREPEVPVDAQMTELVSLEVPGSVGVDEVVKVVARMSGVAGTSELCLFSTTSGSLDDGDVAVTLDDTGLGTAIADYTAPATPGSATLLASVGASSTSVTIEVRPAVIVGNNSTIGNGENMVQANTLFGTRFTVPAPLVLRQIGIWTGSISTPTMVRLAVYDTDRTLIAATEPALVVAGRNVFPLTSSQPLPAGPVWIITVFDRITKVYGLPGPAVDSYLGITPSAFNEPMPMTLPLGSTPSLEYSHFLVGI